MPMRKLFTRRVQLIGLVCIALSLAPLVCAEITYRFGLSSTPLPLDGPVLAALPKSVVPILWASLGEPGALEMHPLHSWRLLEVALFGGMPGNPAGFQVAGAAAENYLASVGKGGTSRSPPHEELRKLCLTVWITRNYSPEEALALYAMSVRSRDGRLGLDEAARDLYGSAALDALRIDQLALLIAFSWSPEKNDPRSAPGRAKERRDTLLKRLHAANVIDSQSLAAAESRPLEIVRR